MQSPHGRIVSIDSHHTRNVIVEVAATVACKRCAQGKGCGAGLLAGQPQERRVSAVLIDGLEVHSGDTVSLELAPRNLLQAASIVYGYPLTGAVLAALVAFSLGLGDLAAAGSALAGIVAGVMLARQRLSNMQCLRSLTPVVVEKLDLAVD
jgi:sigma-E factor negative regulatory protein RseC